MREKVNDAEFLEILEQIPLYGEVPFKLWQKSQHPQKFANQPQNPLIAFKYA